MGLHFLLVDVLCTVLVRKSLHSYTVVMIVVRIFSKRITKIRKCSTHKLCDVLCKNYRLNMFIIYGMIRECNIIAMTNNL